MLAWGQGLAAGETAREAGRSGGDRQGGSKQEREKQTEFKTQRLEEAEKRNTEPERRHLEGGAGGWGVGGVRETQDMKGEIEVEIERDPEMQKTAIESGLEKAAGR